MKRKSKFKFCPCCSAPLGSRPVHGKKQLVCTSCNFIFFQNSKPCVGGIVMMGKKILLTRRAIEPFRGYWDIPGGFLEEGEHPEAGLKRELLEELGLPCIIKGFSGILMDTYGDSGDATLSIYYLVEPRGEILHASDDVSEYRFFPLDRLPGKIAFKSVRKMLKSFTGPLPSLKAGL